MGPIQPVLNQYNDLVNEYNQLLAEKTRRGTAFGILMNTPIASRMMMTGIGPRI